MDDLLVNLAEKLPAFAALIWLVHLVFRNNKEISERTALAFKDEATNRMEERALWADIVRSLVKEKDERFEQLTMKLNGGLHEAAQAIGEVNSFLGRRGLKNRRESDPDLPMA